MKHTRYESITSHAKIINRILGILLLILIPGCAGVERSCSGCWADSVGADWVIVELREQDGTPYRCWELRGVSVSNEEASDGIYWLTGDDNLIHISGSYDRVQVKDGQWDQTFREVNLTQEVCRQINASTYVPRWKQYCQDPK